MAEYDLDSADPAAWVGRRQTSEDRIALRTARFMQQTLDQAPDLAPGDPLPLAWHWLFFLEATRISETGRDGHPLRGGFLPPVALPRRMWAGSRLEFHAPMRIGDTVVRNSEIRSITEKQGRSGRLCFVTVGHEYECGGRHLLSEEHDIVYREDPTGEAAAGKSSGATRDQNVRRATFQRIVKPSASLLFRYSALTFNGHRIHYDVDYCREVEGYPGLVVHGPLVATLLLDLLASEVDPESIQWFRFRAVSPLFSPQPFTLNLEGNDGRYGLWATSAAGDLAVDASAELRARA